MSEGAASASIVSMWRALLSCVDGWRGLTSAESGNITMKDADGKRVGEPYQATHIWEKRECQWRLVAAHISEVKP